LRCLFCVSDDVDWDGWGLSSFANSAGVIHGFTPGCVARHTCLPPACRQGQGCAHFARSWKSLRTHLKNGRSLSRSWRRVAVSFRPWRECRCVGAFEHRSDLVSVLALIACQGTSERQVTRTQRRWRIPRHGISRTYGQCRAVLDRSNGHLVRHMRGIVSHVGSDGWRSGRLLAPKVRMNAAN